MDALKIYRAQYEKEKTWYEDEWDKYNWAACKIFDLTTYDSAMDERFVKDILEVCKVILNRETFEYIEDEKNYVKYLVVCQLLCNFRWIEWGTSIRGAFFDVDIYHDWETKQSTVRSRDILGELEWGWGNNPHKIEKVPFTVDNLKALIKFMEE